MNKREILSYLKGEEDRELFARAREVRRAVSGEDVFIRGIIEISSHCARNCLYCGLRADNQVISRYRMAPDAVISAAGTVIAQGVHTLVLQSGDDLRYTREMICRIISTLKKEHPDVAVTLSFGERPFDDYKAFYECGADRYLLKHETINDVLYKKLHPGQSLRRRRDILEYLKKTGYQIGTGGMIGVPFQTSEDIADDIIFVKDIDADMAGFGPFIPQKDTPLHEFPQGSVEMTLRALALVRIVSGDILLPATTALETCAPGEGLFLGLQAGCNVIMPDFTPDEFRARYVIYDGKQQVTLKNAGRAVERAGMNINWGRGDSLKKVKRIKDKG